MRADVEERGTRIARAEDVLQARRGQLFFDWILETTTHLFEDQQCPFKNQTCSWTRSTNSKRRPVSPASFPYRACVTFALVSIDKTLGLKPTRTPKTTA